MEETKDEVNMKEMLNKLIEQNKMLIESKESKEWKLPRKARLNKGRLRRGYVTIAAIQHNREIIFTKAPVEDGTIKLDGFPRIATSDYMLSYKGKPFMIMPYWSMKPFSPQDSLADTEKEKMGVEGRKLVLARMQKEIIKPKKTGSWLWIIFVIIGIVVAYSLLKGGKIF